MTTTVPTKTGAARAISGSLLALMAPCVLLLSGCAQRHAKARPFPWSTFAYTRPVAPAGMTEDVDAGDILADVSLDVAPPPSPLAMAHAVPARPRVVSPAPPATDASSRPDVPQIAPQLTVGEAAAAQQQTNQSVTVAEHNLGATDGKNLNATQKDLVSKVRSFLLEAREAVQSGDWTRARNAAKKAEVLSQELASSL